uniref:Uncharacterized protein n=1 Tax=Oryza sativa subsp. japonica TaxID=39947 RepID=Q6H7B9_ORYSJ|nr:hypothetical protein [Oryza sativa Japonica Group]
MAAASASPRRGGGVRAVAERRRGRGGGGRVMAERRGGRGGGRGRRDSRCQGPLRRTAPTVPPPPPLASSWGDEEDDDKDGAHGGCASRQRARGEDEGGGTAGVEAPSAAPLRRRPHLHRWLARGGMRRTTTRMECTAAAPLGGVRAGRTRAAGRPASRPRPPRPPASGLRPYNAHSHPRHRPPVSVRSSPARNPPLPLRPPAGVDVGSSVDVDVDVDVGVDIGVDVGVLPRTTRLRERVCVRVRERRERKRG